MVGVNDVLGDLATGRHTVAIIERPTANRTVFGLALSHRCGLAARLLLAASISSV